MCALANFSATLSGTRQSGYVVPVITSATIKVRRTVDRVWVLLLGFLHFTMNSIHKFGPQGLKIATWGLCLEVGKKYNVQGLMDDSVYSELFFGNNSPFVPKSVYIGEFLFLSVQTLRT